MYNICVSVTDFSKKIWRKLMENGVSDLRFNNVYHKRNKFHAKRQARTGQMLFLICMLAIPIVNWLVFWLYVNFSSILLAFQTDVAGEIKWTTQNLVTFWKAITDNGNDLNLALKNTGLYFLSGAVITMPLSLLVSYFLSKKISAYKFFRIVFYLPCIIPPIVLTSVFSQSLLPTGPVGELLQKINPNYPINGPLRVNDSVIPTLTIILYTVLTGIGGDMLIFSGAMSRIPHELFESAKLDGCGPLREVVKIVLPLILSTVSTKIVLLISGIFSASGPIMLLVTGEYRTSTIAFWIYNIVKEEGDYNLVATAGLCFTVVLIPLIILVRALMDKLSDVEY